MRIKIDQQKCIGCSLCAELLPEHITMGKYTAHPKDGPLPPELEERAREAAEDCPVGALGFSVDPDEKS